MILTWSSYAGEVTGLTTFTANTPAVASEVNGNFNVVKNAVNNNHGRIIALETNGASPSVIGNISLVNSTATTGNIMKGAVSFLHNYGSNNTFLGEYAGNFTMTGPSNTAIGFQSLQGNTSGYFNTSNGYQSLINNTSGFYNTGSGAQSLYVNTIGSNNTANGAGALGSNTTGNYNTAVGFRALGHNTTGEGNIALGYQAGFELTTGNSNINIGNYGVAGEAITIRIGAGHTRTFIAGIRGITTAYANAVNVVIDSSGQLGTISSSRRVKDHISDMGKASDTLMKLRPVTFYYKTDQNPKGRTLQYGLIAEEVADVAPGLVAHTADGAIETVYYQHLAPMLLNEYQKQQRTIAAQQVLLEKQNAHIAAIEKQVQEVAELKQQLVRMSAMLKRMQQAEQLAAAR